MTSDDWVAIDRWVAAVWPRGAWTPDQSAAAFTMLERYDADVVHEALDRWFRAGRTWPPTASELYAAAGRVVADREAARPALPDGERRMTWSEWTVAAYGRPMTVAEVIAERARRYDAAT